MAAVEVLATLTHAGLRLVATDQGTLRVTPSTAITAEHRALIQTHKPELLMLLASAVPAAALSPPTEISAPSNTSQTNLPPSPPSTAFALLRADLPDLLPVMHQYHETQARWVAKYPTISHIGPAHNIPNLEALHAVLDACQVLYPDAPRVEIQSKQTGWHCACGRGQAK
jgi:hypothetical protein